MEDKHTHIPVLMDEVISFLQVQPGKVYVDATLGGGGHTRAILAADPTCIVIGLDWDQSVIESVAYQLEREFPKRFFFAWGNFSKVDQLVRKVGFDKVDAILADFGTSQIQISNTPGLSVYKDTYLDMRLSASHFRITACDVINTFSQDELAEILFAYADERHGRKIAKAIVETRKKGWIKTTFELAALIKSIVPQSHRRIHPATKTFQALRIFVNKELENIESFLKNSVHVLGDGGRLVCISFHSLEDRIVKHFLKGRTSKDYPDAFFEILTKNVCVASDEELETNRSARSARLRAAILKKTI